MAGEKIVLVWILGFMCWTQGEKDAAYHGETRLSNFQEESTSTASVISYCVCRGLNIALGKSAWTSLDNYPGWTADNAVDGDSRYTLNNPAAGTTCFHGAASPSDWTVDLGRDYQLYDIKVYIWQTSGAWKTRTANSIIYLDNNSIRVCHTFPSVTAAWTNPTDVTCNDTGRYVTIRNPGTGPGHTNALMICEVEIYGCTAGTYGIDCTDSCNCASPPCDRWTGVCVGDCIAGYRGNKCDTICSNLTYGVRCNEKCADRKCNADTTSCDHVSGSCDTGCLSGWTGTDCTTECDNQHYGTNCASVCADRKCNGNSSCDRVTGSCDTGCKAGWEGTDCIQACDREHYGLNCTRVCGTRHCEGSSTCIHTTGKCDRGCQTGWGGIDCTECDNQYYGTNCTSVCADRKCNGNSSCNHVTGSCGQGCTAGWEGTDCTQACDNGHYGLDCTGVCGTRHCEGSSSCIHTTGQCDGGCQTGWHGIDCAECDNQYYGTNCASLCTDRKCNGNSSCDHVTGSCDQGCRQGWNGDDCRQKIVSADSPPVPALIGGVIGAVVLIIVLVLVIVLIRRRGKVNRHREKAKSRPNDIYENVVRAEESKKPAADATFGLEQLNGQAGGASGDFNSSSVDTLEEEEEEEAYDSSVHNTQQEEGRNYYNLDDIRRGHLIPVSQLVVRVREFGENTELSKEEFQQLPDTFLHPYDVSQKPGNKAKNRFKGYYPYNYNRVVLHDIGDGGDYINASYLDGYNNKKQYIAAQGPYRDDIVEDFWRMIWQEGCRVVVMVTGLVEGGKMKCLRYWPETGSINYGNVTVTMETETKLADYTITLLVVENRKASKKRHVTHFHFTTWPDHGVPDTSCLLQYMWRINSTSGQQKHPIVVHCSAGIGRTGTYIAVESLVSQAATEGNVDVVSFVSNMRSQRKNMIQTKEQYLFIYQALMTAVVEGDTSLNADAITQIDLDHMTEVQMGNKTVQQHLEVMASSAETGTSDDVITIPSHTSRTGFFVKTSRPDKEEVWNQIYNSGSRTLVTWGHVDKSYLPSPDRPVSISVLSAIMHNSTVISNHVTLSEIELKNTNQKEGTRIHSYHVNGSVPDPSVSVLIDSLLQWTGQPECESTTIVSHSINETRRLILLVNITSSLQDDGKVNVISNMRRLQSLLGGPRFTVDDVRLCLQFAQRRLESLGVYANL